MAACRDASGVGVGGRGLGGQAGDREDGALGGLHDRFVGGAHTLLHGGGKGLGVALVQALHLLGDAAKQQRQNDAGVAARGAQQGGSHTVGRGGHGVKILFPELGRGPLHGQAHIGAGVPVGNREDVQIVDGLDIGLQSGIGTQDALLEGRRVYHISQISVPPVSTQPMIVSIYTSTRRTGTPADRDSL